MSKKPQQTDDWDRPAPFIHRVTAKPEHIDLFGHVNNAVYNTWLDECAWAHWNSFDLDPEVLAQAKRGMAVIRSESDYLQAAYVGDELDVAVWITASDGRLRAERQYQIRRVDNGKTIFRSLWKLICINLDNGRPARMSKELSHHYQVIKPED
ncbi:MAG: acyl-CoA thioesterase [Robiginitomaculum sp.]|nr:acyl-CoA thioesterase [Robiginitomaculum sp.]MBL4617593.1 acyl-CoA thioesterase [Robiginitomaculum sp.]